MQIDINVKTYSTKERILAFFMAFMIFTMTCPELFEGLGVGLIVHAAAGDGNIHSATVNKTSIYTSRMNDNKDVTGNDAYTYTGKYTNDNTTTLFDYISDYELRSGGAYNTCQQDENNYVDVYKQLNKAISDNYVSSDKIQIIFEPADSYKNENVHIYFFGGSETPYAWPGTKMSYDTGNGVFYYTAKYTDLNSPTKFIINDGNNSAKWQTEDLTCPSAGKSLTVTQTNGNKVLINFVPDWDCNDTVQIHYWGNNTSNDWNSMTQVNGRLYTYDLGNNRPQYIVIRKDNEDWKTVNLELLNIRSGLTYKFEKTGTKEGDGYKCNMSRYISVSSSTSTNFYDTKYSRPLYFGTFLMDPAGTSYPTNYTDNNRPVYNNFYWQANMGLKPASAEYNGVSNRGTAVVKNLVKGTLSGDPDNNSAGNLLDVNSPAYNAEHPENQIQLPYFDKSSSLFTDGLMRYYDTDTDGGHLTFPFYEVYKDAETSGEYERYYQFDSREANLVFNFGNINQANNHTGYFSESNVDISRGYWQNDTFVTGTIKSDRSNVGFFPFNTSNSETSTTNTHNLGFGLKFQMDFKLEYDGRVSAMKKNATTGALEPKDNASRVATIFEFTGDDDLWVFIDGNLVLDMGGDHNKAYGKIDFYNKEVTVEKETTFGAGNGYNDLGASVTSNATQLNGDTFISKLSGTNFTGANADKYDTTETHTLTVFYMERGMMDSNLSIRYNYSPIANTSRMKIAEVTKFTGVNSGLLDLTKQAAEDDVFKYTISNTIPEGVTTETPLDSGAKYPVTTKHERTAEDRTTKTVLTHDLDNTTPAEKKFTPGAADTPTYVKDTAYWWVDGFSDTDYLAGKTTNASGTAGQSGYKPGGDFWLMYGTNDSVYDSTNTGKESSAEFEKQFTRGSKMTIVQGDNIYRINQPEPGDPRTLFDVSGNLTAKEWDGQVHTDEDGAGASARPSRAVDDYYTTKYRLVDRKFNQLFYETSETYTAIGQNARNATFTFSNDDGVSEHLATMLTEYVENTVRVGTLLITNRIENGDPGQEFTYTIKLDNVFGVGGEVSDYTALSATKSTIPTTSGSSRPVKTTSTSAVENNFMTNSVSGNTATFKLKDGEQVVITGIPLGTTYSVTQQDVSDQGFTTNVTGSDNTTATVSTLNGSGWPYKGHENQAVHFKSTRQSEITAQKTDGHGNGLPGAELKLYVRENELPPTYSFNEPQVVPSKVIENKIPADNGITIPDAEIVSETIKIKDKSIEYGSDTPPTASDSDWILPRNDSDYIYFRDYNDASDGGFLGDKDKTSFGSSEKVAWRETKFEPNTNSGVHGQDEEIGFKDEGEGKYPWVAAQFTKNNGQDFVEYAVWERFVDTYNDIQTVVWKIQPADGYDEVRFCLYYGDKCVRTTKRFKFKLGKIYHKTNWGSSYSSDNGGSYWDVPVTVETANSGYWAPVNASVNDKRMSGSTMAQARKYEPTEQKIIFHCNSQEVWHNIHIEFFEDAEGNLPVNGQPFPGYMMEPYAYAGSDYRLSDGYLTYELTIPKTANYFRINNGVDNSPVKGSYSLATVANGQSRYAYRTNIQEISKTGGKNYDNYYVLATSGRKECLSNSNPIEVSLIKSVNAITSLSYENTNVSYTDKDVDSDYDYIYFEKPSGWQDHVYAYFYGGGNLRADNWQRACYSAWPGVAAAGTEYTDNGTQYYSSTYNYPIADDANNTTLEKYNGTTLAANKLSPESTFKNSNSKTVYKFRIPKGDRKNYSKVIFNDGLSSQGGKYETGVIDYESGYLYRSDGSCQKHYDNNPTVTYTARTGNDDYIYVKIDSTTADTWDDPHITFYDNYGRQLLQGGHGYVMDYAGTKTVNEGTTANPNNVTYQYYRVPIPADSTGVTQFKINNGISREHETTSSYPILRKGVHEETVTSTDYTEGKLVYKLSGNTLTRTEPTFKETELNTSVEISGTQNSGVDYTTRGDKLKILDDAPWITAANFKNGIGTFKVKFYTSNGVVIGITGTYTMIQSKEDANHQRWYTIDIPDYAAKFTLTSPKGTTAPYDIYTKVAANAIDSSSGNRTADGMYYHTKSDGTLALIDSTVVSTGNAAEANDETYSKRGDNLYLVTSYTFSDIKVVFYGADGTAFQTDANAITAKYIADEQVNLTTTDHWYKVSIPKNAVSFKVIANNGAVTLRQADIYELKTKIARYKENYTLGDMQYRITNTDGSAPTLLYPVFTQDDEYTIDVGGNTISSNIAIPQVDESAVSGYSKVGVTPVDDPAISESAGVVLYNTTAVTTGNYQQAAASSTVDKKWTEGAGTTTEPVDNYIWFDDTNTGWGSGTIKIKFSDSVGSGTDVTDSMSYNSTKGLYYYAVPTNDNYCSVEIWHSGSHSTEYVTLSNKLNASNYYGKSCTITPTVTSGASGYLWYHLQSGDGTHNNMKAYFYNSSSGSYKEVGNDGGQQTIQINNVNNYFWKFSIPNNVSSYDRVVLYNDQTNYKYFTRSSTSGVYYITINSGNSYGSGMVLEGTSSYESYKTWAGSTTYYGCISKSPRVYVSDNIRDIINNNSETTLPQWRQVNIATSTYASYLGTTTYSATIGSPVTHEVGGSATYTATYQPEDRYGYVSSINSAYGDTADDKNNYIYINTSNVTTSGFAPYVRFYTNTAGNEGEICGVNTEDSTDTINIKADQVATNLYRVRMPKNAKSFKIVNGASGNFNSASAILLEETVRVNASTGQPATTGDTVQITGFRHAGTTFVLDSTGTAVQSKTLRTGYTISKDEAMADPLNPKTDSDFVYFTDSDSFANNGQVYAYFYGDVDGAYTSWPGVKAMTPNNGVADTTYTDNYSKKVYAFRIPKGSEGKYSKVIFTNGKTDSNIKITQAQDLEGGKNYVLNVDNNNAPVSGGRNGAFTTAAYTANAASDYQKSAVPTADYSTDEGKTIYIINNGTPDAVGESGPTERTPLDDIHVVFYDANNNAINHTDGYKPDKVVDEQYEDTDVYKITVPDNAEYFQITNGTGKGSSGGRERHSEIKKLTDKGLYRFIEPSEVTAANKDASSGDNYVQETTFNSTLSANTYLLGLANQIQESDEELPTSNKKEIHIATIVTGADGKQDYIKWLKKNAEGTAIDTNYFLATVAGSDSVTAVNQEYDNENEYTKCKTIKLAKSGDYFWTEAKAPTGYEQTQESTNADSLDNSTEISNNPIKGDLKLVKELAPGMPSTLNSPDFVYTVTLTPPTGKKFTAVSGNGSTTTVTMKNADDTGDSTTFDIVLKKFDPVNSTTHEDVLVAGSYEENPSVSGNNVTFKVAVSKSAYMVVQDIPYDVGYSVSEAVTAPWKQVDSAGTSGTITANDIYTASFTNTYTQVAELVVHEVVLNGRGTHSNDIFTFEVNFEAPTGVAFTTDYFTFKDKDNHNITLPNDNITVTVPTVIDEVEVSPAGKYAIITVKLTHNTQNVTIGNVPYGTKYTVKQEAMPANTTNTTWHKITEYYSAPVTHTTSTGAGTETQRTINAPTQHFTAENAITGGLQVSKTTANATGTTATLPSNTKFIFNLTLSGIPAGLSLSSFPISTSGINATNTVSNITATGSNTYTITITNADTVTVLGIPQDVKVNITEGNMPSANWSQTSATHNTNITIGDSLASDAASFTNSYTPTSITLFKQDSSNNAGIPGAKFYLLKLANNIDIDDEDVKNTFATGTINSSNQLVSVDDSTTVYATVVGELLTTGNGENGTELGFITLTADNTTAATTFSTGDKYFFFEAQTGTTTAMDGVTVIQYEKDNTLTAEKVIEIKNDKYIYSVEYDNERVPTSTDVDITKKGTDGKLLGGAIFDLWYENTTIPKIYSPNNPFPTPSWTATKTVKNDITVPGPENIETPATPPSYTYTYQSVDVPSSTDKEWILPRSDNDYIYFRDYNTGSTYWGDYGWGKNNSPDDDRRWINTWFDPNEFGQSEEIFYDHRYWIKAVFSAPGKETKSFAVWERFVDDYYSDGKTVVWKIQPPDGYKYVEFVLCDGDNHVRNTETFKYVLGNIYTKTNKGRWDGGQYGYPVKGEHWSTNWNGMGNSASDKRQNYSSIVNSSSGSYWQNTNNYVFNDGDSTNNTSSQSAPKQTDRYTPTEQKIVFHCNSYVVWHNIHIEFFTTNQSDASDTTHTFVQNGVTYYPVGQGTPGYLMEPYAYAGDNYRINGYLTYELTIPKEATHFRVNNGVTNGSYYFRSEVTALHTADDRNGRKNYGNYFKIQDSARHVPSNRAIKMTDWTSYPTGNDKDSWNESYSTIDVNSDYDYVYFKAPSNWGSHIYAYFYAGGELQEDIPIDENI